MASTPSAEPRRRIESASRPSRSMSSIAVSMIRSAESGVRLDVSTFATYVYSVRLQRKSAQEVQSMFAAWGRLVYRRRWPVLGISGFLLVASAFIVVQGGKLQSGGLIETSHSALVSR